MKKPNITEGEWLHFGSTIESNGNPIAQTLCNYHKTVFSTTDEEKLANAKAISSVPEMIEALIEARQTLAIDDHDEGVRTQVSRIDNALKKAGVEL